MIDIELFLGEYPELLNVRFSNSFRWSAAGEVRDGSEYQPLGFGKTPKEALDDLKLFLDTRRKEKGYPENLNIY